MKNRISPLAFTLCSVLMPAQVSAMQQLTCWRPGDTRTVAIAASAGLGGALLAIGAQHAWHAWRAPKNNDQLVENLQATFSLYFQEVTKVQTKLADLEEKLKKQVISQEGTQQNFQLVVESLPKLENALKTVDQLTKDLQASVIELETRVNQLERKKLESRARSGTF